MKDKRNKSICVLLFIGIVSVFYSCTSQVGNVSENMTFHVNKWKRYSHSDTTQMKSDTLRGEDTNFVYIVKNRIKKSTLDSLIDYPEKTKYENLVIEKMQLINFNSRSIPVYRINTMNVDFNIGTIIYAKEYGVLVRQIDKGVSERLETIEIRNDHGRTELIDVNALGYAIMHDSVLIQQAVPIKE